MRISKVLASEEVDQVVSTEVETEASEEEAKPISKYAEGISHIRQAIDALGVIAAEDSGAHDAILDLAVVCAYLKNREI